MQSPKFPICSHLSLAAVRGPVPRGAREGEPPRWVEAEQVVKEAEGQGVVKGRAMLARWPLRDEVVAESFLRV
jgi:hypothetical protein